MKYLLEIAAVYLVLVVFSYTRLFDIKTSILDRVFISLILPLYSIILYLNLGLEKIIKKVESKLE